MKKKIMIATVGTSLIGGLLRNQIDWNLPPEQIVKRMNELDDNSRISAEVSSILSMFEQGMMDELPHLFLLASDTEEGEKICQILKMCFADKFAAVHVCKIRHLNGANAEFFMEEGLRNLVKVILQIVISSHSRESEYVINATGGYKAQISFAGLIGQAMRIPVYYQFEGFSHVLKLPEMPVAFDYKIWLKNFPLFKELAECETVSPGVLEQHGIEDSDELNGLIEKANGQIRLSTAGLLFHGALWKRFNKEGHVYLPPAINQEQMTTMKQLPDDSPVTVQKILQTIHRRPYVKYAEIMEIKENLESPVVFTSRKQHGLIQGSYGENNQTWIFAVQTTATDKLETNAAIVDLYQSIQHKNIV